MTSLPFNTLSTFVIAFLPRSKHLLASWLRSLSTVILQHRKIKSVTASTFSLSDCHDKWSENWNRSSRPGALGVREKVRWEGFAIYLKLTRHCKLTVKEEVLVTQLRMTLCYPMDCSPPGSSVHGVLQA